MNYLIELSLPRGIIIRERREVILKVFLLFNQLSLNDSFNLYSTKWVVAKNNGEEVYIYPYLGPFHGVVLEGA